MNASIRIIRSATIMVLLMGSWVYGKAQSNTFPSSGNVGIGTLSPTIALSVVGQAGFSNVGSAPSGNKLAVTSPRGDLGLVFFSGDGQGNLSTRWDIRASSTYFAIENNIDGIGSGININVSGNIGIGTISPTAKLSVNGTTKTKEVIVTDQAGDWPDYVFADPEYQLPSLGELETYINEYKHLPGIPTKADIEKEGQYLGAIQAKLLEKIEELTLHTISQQNLIVKQQKENEQLRQRIELIEEQLYQK